MYIACPECDAKFVVNTEQIGKHGRKVKCSKCSHVWHQKLDNHIKVEPTVAQSVPEITPLGNGINLPALLPIKIPPYLYGLPVLLIGIITFMAITLFPNIFGISSILNDQNLSIRDLQITNNQELSKITVSYKVLNSSNKTIKMPLVRIRLFDKNNRVIKSRIDDYSKIELTPSQNVSINTEFTPAPTATENIDITIGSKLDFILR